MFSAHRGTSPLRAPSLFFLSFLNHFLVFRFFSFCSLFTSFLDHYLAVFSSFGYHLFEHDFCIDCSLMLWWFWYHFWCFFDTFPVHTCNLLNHHKQLFLQWIFMFLPFRETLFLMLFLIFFVTSFGIDFRWVLVSISAPFWDPFGIKFHVFGWSFLLMNFWIDVFQKLDDGTLPFRSFFACFFRTLVSFTFVRLTSARNHFFQLFSTNFKKNITLVPFTHVRPTSAPWPVLLFFWEQS